MMEQGGGAIMNAILGERIRSLRAYKNMTQEELAGSIGCTRQKIARMEKGEIDITYKELQNVSAALDVTIDVITAALDGAARSSSLLRVQKGSPAIREVEIVQKLLDQFLAQGELYRRTHKGTEP
jgi:transcriptional regulator with XRE-family HTH domain